MKKLKSILAMALAICMCLSMVGCGNVENVSETDSKKTVINNNPKNIESAEMYSGKFQLGDTMFSYPIMGADLLASGAVFSSDPETAIVPSKENIIESFTLDGITYEANFVNYNEYDISIKDAELMLTSKLPYICPKGITIGTSVKELIEKWGQPSQSMSNERSYWYIDQDISYIYGGSTPSASGNYYTVSIDTKTQTISGISSKVKIETEEMVEINGYVLDSDKNKINWSYKIFDYLSDNMYVYTYDGKEYFFYKNIDFHSYEKAQFNEFTDTAIKESIMQHYENQSKKQSTSIDYDFSFNYKINGSSAVVIERSSYAGVTYIDLIYINSDFNLYKIEFNIKHNDESKISEEALTAVDEILFAIGETVKISGE